MSLDTLTHLAQTSGGILYIMALLLFIALAVSVERFWAISRMLASAKGWILELKSHAHVDVKQLKAKVEDDADSPAAQVVAVALQHDLADPLDHFTDRLEEAVMDQAPRIDRGLWMLAGLFIAVLGLVAFNALNQRVRLVMHQLERIKLMLSNRMYPHYREGGVRPVVVAQNGQAVRPAAQSAATLQQKMA
ncbi:MAG: biopolymer transporter ExbB [Thiomonas sp. 14-64-326]|nr:MAG: biopolymer transporter ExbB [Thiomonas sp. 14-64-326]